MARDRPRKRSRQKLSPVSGEDSTASDGGGAKAAAPASAKKKACKEESSSNQVYKKRRVAVKAKIDLSERDTSAIFMNEEEDDAFEKQYPATWCDQNTAFCCGVCRCTETMKTDPNIQLAAENPDEPEYETRRQLNEKYPFIFPDASHDVWPHRICCHKVWHYEEQETFAPLILAGQNTIVKSYEDISVLKKFRVEPRTLEWVTPIDIESVYNTVKKQENELYNNDGLPAAKQILLTHSVYCKLVEEPFAKHCAQRQEHPETLRKAVVLDAFAGVGTGVAVIKKLGIAIEKVVTIEKDKVATHVNRSNHDVDYNKDLPKDHSVLHEYIDTWESFQQISVEELLQKYGPIDIVIGGPPCVDYSQVNATRKGTSGQQGRYMISFLEKIKTLKEAQQAKYPSRPLFFLVENVPLKGDDLTEACKAIGYDWDPVRLDALYVSPARRNRNFFTNIAFEDVDYDGPLSHSTPECCIEHGFCVPAHFCEDDLKTVKAQCLMASASKIDDSPSLRMYVFRKEASHEDGEPKYTGRPLNVAEREKLMGYKEGYVENPVRELFEKVRTATSLLWKRDGNWREIVDEKYHCFAGNYHNLPKSDVHCFELIADGTPEGELSPRFEPELMMAPPLNSSSGSPVFFNSEDYAKHLIGNAFSVPVVEHLLKPLQQLFCKHKYTGYQYSYAWEANSIAVKQEDTDEDCKPRAVKREDTDDGFKPIEVKGEASAEKSMRTGAEEEKKDCFSDSN